MKNSNAMLANLVSFLKLDVKKQIRFTQAEVRRLETQLINSERKFLHHKVVSYHQHANLPEYRKEADYLESLDELVIFPYKKVKTLPQVEGAFDDKLKMPYVLHKSHKLYFPSNWDVEKAKTDYRNYIELENILGGDYAEKSPHQYQSQAVHVQEGDVVLDIGSAEALFSLDVIDKARKIYIFEYDEKWVAPLKATFAPFGEKVVITYKRVSDRDSETEVRLDTCLRDEDKSKLFIKLDIEGYEVELLKNNEALLRGGRDIRIACCTYHNHHDAENTKRLLEDLNYEIEFSDGYMLFIMDPGLRPPYFRKAMIRGRKAISNQPK